MMEHYHSIKPLECTVVGPGVVVKVEEEETYNPHNAQNCGTDSVCVSTKREVKTEGSEEMAGRRKLKAEDRHLFQENNIGCVKLKPEVIIKEEDNREAPLMNKEEMCADGQSFDVAAEHKMNCDVKVKIEEDDQSYVMADHPFEERDSSPAASPDYFLVQVKEEEEDLAFGMDYQQQGEAVVCPQTSSGREKDGRMQRMPSKMFINIAQLIQMVQMRPEIYDPKVPSYADRYKKKKAWDEICAVVVPDWDMYGEKEKNIRAKEIQTRWRSLKDCFRRELTLQKKLERSGIATNKRRKYIHYDGLLFLEPTMKLRDSLGNNPAPPAPTITRDPFDIQHSAEIDQAASSPRPLPTPPLPLKLPPQIRTSPSGIPFVHTATLGGKKNKKKPPNKNENEWEKQLLSVMSTIRKKTEERTDPDEIFLKSLLPFVRKVPEDRKIDMQLSLMHVVKKFMGPAERELETPNWKGSNATSASSHSQAGEQNSATRSQTKLLHRRTRPPSSASDPFPYTQEQEALPASHTFSSPSSSPSSTNRSPPSHRDSPYYFDL